MSYKSAQEWAQEHMDGDNYETEFGTVEDADDIEKAVLTISMTAAEAEMIRKAAREAELSVSAYIVKMCTK